MKLRIWTASIVMMVCSWLSYVDRQTLAVLSPTILAETGMSVEDYTKVGSAFNYAYMLANPVWGSVLDRFGLRIGMFFAVGLWTIASASHASWPDFGASLRLVRFWDSAREQRFRVGSARRRIVCRRRSKLAELRFRTAADHWVRSLRRSIILPFAASRWVAFGVLGDGCARISVARAVVVHGSTAVHRQSATQADQDRVAEHFRAQRFWALVSVYAVGAFALSPILTLVPVYLNRALGCRNRTLRSICGSRRSGWEVGYFFWGWASDQFGYGKGSADYAVRDPDDPEFAAGVCYIDDRQPWGRCRCSFLRCLSRRDSSLSGCVRRAGVSGGSAVNGRGMAAGSWSASGGSVFAGAGRVVRSEALRADVFSGELDAGGRDELRGGC